MLCGYPVKANGTLVACGRCMNCRINKKREWAAKIILEMTESKVNSTFLTLTYDDKNLPEGRTLVKQHMRDYIDKLRNGSLGKIRYFAVGEYGENTDRPHYHMAIFNTPPAQWENYFYKKWEMGNIKADELNVVRASYIAQYCTKKMTDKEDERLDGRTPEFQLSSKRPPLGAAGIGRIITSLYSQNGARALTKLGDVPHTFRFNGKIWPISKYWIEKMRNEIGIDPLHIKNADHMQKWTSDYETIKEEDQQRARKAAEKGWRTRNRRRSYKL